VNNIAKMCIVAALVAGVGGVLYLRSTEQAPADSGVGQQPAAAPKNTETTPPAGQAAEPEKALPRLLELGAGKCQACKAMKPILDELTKTYEGRLEVTFIDVWKDPDAAKKYGIRLIPTQIFFDAAGKEVFRHEGFYPREDILKKFKESGIDLDAAPQDAQTSTGADTGQSRDTCAAGSGDPVVLRRPGGTPLAQDRFVAFLCHSARPCPCGRTIGAGAAKAISDNYADEVKAGKLECMELDVQDEANAHYAEKYELAPVDHLHNGLVVVEIKDNKPGRWKKLDRADDLKNSDKYPAYVKDELAAFMRAPAANTTGTE